MESHLEARLWNDVFVFAQDYVGVPQGSIRATVLIETILASFEMDEILYELREHSAGLNCGRWDYIFSYIKKLGHRPDMILPDRAEVTMDKAFLKAYVDLLIQTCHKRGIHAMGGMAAQIPIKNDPVANETALKKFARISFAKSMQVTMARGWLIPAWSRWLKRSRRAHARSESNPHQTRRCPRERGSIC